MIGKEGDTDKAEELFAKMDKNSDGMVSQDEFIAIIQQDKSLLGVLEGKAWLVLLEIATFGSWRRRKYQSKNNIVFKI